MTLMTLIKKAYHSFKDHKIILESIRYVDIVIPEITWEQKVDDIKKFDDIFTWGMTRKMNLIF